MAQAKKKTATKTNKKTMPKSNKSCAAKKVSCSKKQSAKQHSNSFFMITMSMLAAALLFADLFMMML